MRRGGRYPITPFALTQVTVRSVHESGAAGTVRIFLCNEVDSLCRNTIHHAVYRYDCDHLHVCVGVLLMHSLLYLWLSWVLFLFCFHANIAFAFVTTFTHSLILHTPSLTLTPAYSHLYPTRPHPDPTHPPHTLTRSRTPPHPHFRSRPNSSPTAILYRMLQRP